ncbi:MAG: VOC family protein [Candidatus Babeliales bacterium]
MITNVTHLTVFVENQDQALDFYTNKLGFKVHTDAQFGPMRWLTIHPIENKNYEISLMLAETPEEKALVGKQAIQKPLFCVSTNDCKAAVETFKASGVTFLQDAKEEQWGTSATFVDLYGNIIYMVQPAQY